MSEKFFSDYCKEIRIELGYSREKAAELMKNKPDYARQLLKIGKLNYGIRS